MSENHNQRIGLEDILGKDKLEVSSHIFYRKEYRDLSNDAKIIYQYILKRFSVSEINYAKAIEEDTIEDFTFVDENNKVFCFVSNDELQFVANISEKTVIKAKKELQVVNLLEEVKQTANKNNRLYLNRIILDLQDKLEFKKELDAFKTEQKKKRLEKNKKRKKVTNEKSNTVGTNLSKKKDEPKPDKSSIHNPSESEPQKLQFNEPQKLQFMNRKNYGQSTKESFSSLESLSTLETLNLNLTDKEKIDYMTLWDLKIPKELKVKIKVLLANNNIKLSNEELLEVEEAYHYQVLKQNVIPDCEPSNLLALNDFQFSSTVLKMFETVKEIDSIKAMIDSWVKRGIDYKNSELGELDYQSIVDENMSKNGTLSKFKEVFENL